ncbi:hypothetical protein ILUMI_17985 [Ignelater luminosus]|uniref:Uncharacterized protein n=1 Tax=Ignelater luminosus TaxID=2038154 RepID=A0A8K0CIW9_IGNLU|nr:hypothetical protein ILUMI_17985 [Ignelater luminosus]
MPRCVLPVDQLIKNLYDYFTKEKSNLGPLMPVTQVRARVVDALPISEFTLKTALKRTQQEDVEQIVSEGEEVSSNEQDVQQLVRVNECAETSTSKEMNKTKAYKKRAKLKTTDLPDTLLMELKAREVIDISCSSLRQLLFNIGFKYLKDNNRRALCEKPAVVQQRQVFLRKIRKLEAKDYNFVYLDETWIFSRGGCKRSWQNNDVRSVKNVGGEGKRFIVLHAGDKNGFIDGVSLVFSSKPKSADYHDSMNAVVHKMAKRETSTYLKQKSVIVLDNASKLIFEIG